MRILYTCIVLLIYMTTTAQEVHDDNIHRGPLVDSGTLMKHVLAEPHWLKTNIAYSQDTIVMWMYGHPVMKISGGQVFIDPYRFPKLPNWDWPNDNSWLLIYDMKWEKTQEIFLNKPKPKHKKK